MPQAALPDFGQDTKPALPDWGESATDLTKLREEAKTTLAPWVGNQRRQAPDSLAPASTAAALQTPAAEPAAKPASITDAMAEKASKEAPSFQHMLVANAIWDARQDIENRFNTELRNVLDDPTGEKEQDVERRKADEIFMLNQAAHRAGLKPTEDDAWEEALSVLDVTGKQAEKAGVPAPNVMAGLQRAAIGGTAKQFLTKEGAVMLPLFAEGAVAKGLLPAFGEAAPAMAKAGSTALGRLFVGQMIAGAPGQISSGIEALKRKDYGAAAEAFGSTALTAAFVGAHGKGEYDALMAPGKIINPDVQWGARLKPDATAVVHQAIEETRGVAPLTADALAQAAAQPKTAEKGVTDAVQIKSPDAEVLREPGPEVGLPQVGARDAETKVAAEAQKPAAPEEQAANEVAPALSAGGVVTPPEPKPEHPKPPTLRPGEKGTGDLLQGGDAPFNLSGEKASDGDRIAAEKAKAEKTKQEAAAIAAKQQQELPGSESKPKFTPPAPESKVLTASPETARIVEHPSVPMDFIESSQEYRNPAIIEEYRKKIRAGESLPPVEVVIDQKTGKFSITDGHHKYEAAKLEGLTHIPAIERIMPYERSYSNEEGLRVGEARHAESLDRGQQTKAGYTPGTSAAEKVRDRPYALAPGQVRENYTPDSGPHRLDLFPSAEAYGRWVNRGRRLSPSGTPDLRPDGGGSSGIIGMGGAIPSEFEHSQQTPTSIKNAQVDIERAKRGLPEAVQPARRDFGEVWDKAMARIDRDPGAQDHLIAELKARPRALTDEEDAMLLHRQIDLQNEYGKASRDMAQAYDDGRMEALQEDKLRLARFSDQLLDLYNIGKKAGTETGRGLNARKMMAYEDFTLAKMELDKRVANNGKPLTVDQTAEVQRLHDLVKATQEKYDAHVAKTEAERQARAVDTTLADIQRDLANEQAASRKYRSLIDQFAAPIHREADAARQRLKNFFKPPDQMAGGMAMHAGLDTEVLSDLAVVGMSHILRGAAKLETWGAKMATEFGDAVKPNLQEIWDKSNQLLTERAKKHTPGVQDAVKQVVGKKDTIDDVKGKIEKRINDDEMSQIGPLVQRLARLFVEQGIKDREPLIDAVHKVLSDIVPDITRRETMDAISGYGKFAQLSKDQVSIELRDLKGQMQQVAKLEDIQARKPIQKTGVERRPQSDTERRLIQQVNEAKRRFGVVVTDPARQLKSALDAIKTNLKNRISDLQHQLDTGQKIVRQKTGVPYDQEALTLKAQRDKLKEQYTAMFGKPEMTDEQRVKVATSSLESSIAEYERRIKDNDLSSRKQVSKTPKTPELEALRTKRDALKEQLQELKDAANPKKTPEEIALQSLKTRLKNRTVELQDKLARADFSTKARRPVVLDAEAQTLKAANEAAKLEFRRGLTQDRLKNRTNSEKVQDTIVKWRRGFLLSGVTTLGKLTTAAIYRLASSPIEEVIGAGFSELLPGVAARAPSEGGLNVQAEAKANTYGIKKGMADSWQTLKTGHSELDTLYGKPDLVPHTAIDFFGHLHGALKAPVKRVAFERSLEKRMAHAAANGVDITDPLVQTRLSLEAYRDAQRSIFMQDNRVVSAYKRALTALDEKNKVTGKVPAMAKAAATTARVLLPIVKVPTNIVAETLQYATGSITGSYRLARALHEGVSTLKPEQADLILRDLKKGSLGAALLLVGYFAPNAIGGYYQRGEKRKPGDVKAGSVKVFGHQIPSFLLHNPLLETMQIGATIRRVADSKLKKSDPATQGIGSGLFAGAVGLMEEVPFFREMFGELPKIMDAHTRTQFFGELVKSGVTPQIVQWIAQQMDKNDKGDVIKRKPATILQHVETGLPYFRQQVPKDKHQPVHTP